MKLLISNAQVCDIQSPFHGKICDILVSGGVIEQITVSAKKAIDLEIKGLKQLNAKGLLLFPGLFDMRADFCDPGNEHKETLQSGAKLALAGGFTDVAVLPSTIPARDSKIGIDYVVKQSNNLPINLYPYGCLSQNRDGIEMAELYDMKLAGAIGFTDGNRPISNSGLLLRTLIYNKIFNGLTLVLADDANISAGGKMHEGDTSTVLGLKGIPSLSEEIMIQRDIELVKYSEGRLHFSAITTKGTVEIIRRAKKQGLKVTADVAFANLCFADTNLLDYDANFKLVPPLRSKADQKALWDGVQDGTIDAIVSNHLPQNKENKEVEFEYAQPGMISLQVLLPILLANKPESVELSSVIRALSAGPRNLLELPKIMIEKGAVASLTLFNSNKSWVFNNNFSKSENTPFLKQKIQGAIAHVVCKNALYNN
jgi:dihydroorotase